MSVDKIALIIEHEAGAIRPISYELIAAARAIANDAAITAIVLGDDPAGVAERFATVTGVAVIAVAIPGLPTYLAEVYLAALPPLLDEIGARVVCLGHTPQGWDCAPGLAVALDAACITAVEGVASESGRLVFRKTTHNGKIVSHIAACTERVVLTVLPGSFGWRSPGEVVAGKVTTRTVNAPPCATRHLGPAPAEEADRGLAAAEVIIAAGRGLGKRENLSLVQRLSAAIPKSAVAGSRPVCDAGWLPYNRQVGQTGAVVRPKVYLACGISGAAQHAYGMKDSGFIVAINHDPHAPIFRLADVGIVEDVVEFLPALIAEIAGRKW
jgi:electron transfer flavoprotein alpha subunit